ncbi:MAG: DUF433 domain-containing protein [Gluconacetobacter diazotrophicus]|nr:DUF433 domain-containing protein [Gluconacetobacter diazotrophicus]
MPIMGFSRTSDVTVRARVVENPKILGGMPTVEGTRVPAATIAAYLRAGRSDDGIREDYPTLPPDGIDAVRDWVKLQPSG